MKMLLRAEYPNGYFGDPALYVYELNRKGALLFDCGDLSRYSTRELLKVTHLFISHCHIDHFFDFDHFLRIHVGSEKSVTLYGPPDFAARVGGKLQGYTWNLVFDQNLEFITVELDAISHLKRYTRFHARDAFKPSDHWHESWYPHAPVLDTGFYQVHATTLDHRTPSMAYAIEERLKVQVNSDALRSHGLIPGPWLNELKNLFLFGGLDRTILHPVLDDGRTRQYLAAELAQLVLIPRQRHKIAYSTDGAANAANRERLLELVKNADLWVSETCFTEADRAQADATRHFTARFIAEIARDANVKKLAPIHFSKRYIEDPEQVLAEIRQFYRDENVIRKRQSGARA